MALATARSRGRPRGRGRFYGARFELDDPPSAVLYPVTQNSKLAPVDMVEAPGTSRGKRPRARGPYCASTYVSIAATCPDSCAFKDAGCYVTSGFYRRTSEALDAAAEGASSLEVMAVERELLEVYVERFGVPRDGGRDGRKGRDLRLHVGGDVGSAEGAREVARGAEAWLRAGGGRVWTYTHHWRTVPRSAFGSISVLASVESEYQAERARCLGYTPAIVVPRFEQSSAYRLRSGLRLVPCPAELSGRQRSCIECRLCFDSEGLYRRDSVIGFEAHGTGAREVRRRLEVVR